MINRRKLIDYEKMIESFFHNNKFSVLGTCLVNICTIGLTFLLLKSDDERFVPMFMVILVVLAVIAIGIFIHLACIDWRYHYSHLKDAINSYELSKSLPETLIFRNREDSFVVKENGDAILTWYFEIEKVTNNNLTFISLPTICERKDSSDDSLQAESVQITSFTVNGKEQNNHQYEFLSLDTVDHKGKRLDRPLEKGMIRIPLFTASKKGGIDKIELSILFKGMFNNYKTLEYAVIDIPYITKKIQVTIEHEKNDVYDINVVDNYLDVRELHSNTFDAGELAKQLNNCTIVHEVNSKNGQDIDCLTWSSEYPKLGYRYKLKFNFIKHKRDLILEEEVNNESF